MGKQISDSEILDDIKRVGEKIGSAPSEREYSKSGNHSFTTVQERFGSWSKGVELAGFEPNRQHQKISKDDLIADISGVADDLGKAPKCREYDSMGNYSARTAQEKFGSWNEALEKANLKPNKNVDDETMLQDLIEVAEKLGRRPTWDEYSKYGNYTPRSFTSRFDTGWKELAQEASIIAGHPHTE